jgi:hypothetical protein
MVHTGSGSAGGRGRTVESVHNHKGKGNDMKRTRFVPSATKMIPITLVALLTMAVPSGAVAQVSFTRILEGDIAQDTGLSTGCAWGDYDNDGYPDLIVAYAVNGSNRLYHNNGDGTFSRVAAGPIANDSAECGAVWGDYDNDGDLDLFVTNWFKPDCFYRNEGNGVFTKVTQGAWVTDTGRGNGAAWADYDNDGFLDLYVVNFAQNNFLYHNNGDGTMTPITSGPPVTSGGQSFACTWTDYDGDGDVDLLVSCAQMSANEQQFRNNGDGTFTQITQGSLVNSGGDTTQISPADYDNDGDLDLWVAELRSNKNRFYRNDGAEGLTLVTPTGLTSGQSCNGAWGDYDNDGYLDLFISNDAGQDNFLFHNNGDGTFAQVTEGALVHDGGRSGGCAWADYDNDGDLDLFVANGLDYIDGTRPPEPGFLYRNDGGTNHWLLLRLVGVASNRSAIGAKVRVFATIGGKSFWQLREVSGGTGMSQNDLRVHFGLGDAVMVESVRIEWPSGITQFLRDVAVNQLLTVTEEDPTLSNTAPRIPPACPDFNTDGMVDAQDEALLVEHLGQDDPRYDIGPFAWGDGVVDDSDLAVLAQYMGKEWVDPTLRAHWALDEAEGIIAADSVAGQDAGAIGIPVWQPAGGQVKGALGLDGATFFKAPFVLSPAQGRFSILAWIKGGAPGQVILSQVSGANWLAADAVTGALMTDLSQGGRGAVGLSSEAIITDGNWHRIAFTWDGANRRLYVDSTLVAEDAHGSLAGSTDDLLLGAGKTLAPDTFWSGLIDDIRIYNRAVAP